MQLRTNSCENERLQLAGDLLRAGETAQLRVLGLSMLPTIWPGDLLTIQGISDGGLHIGDIAVFERDGGWIIHRVIALASSGLITRGDCMTQADEVVARDQLLGKVIRIRRGDRGREETVPHLHLSLVQQALARILCYSGRMRSLALRIQRFRYAKLASEGSRLQPNPIS